MLCSLFYSFIPLIVIRELDALEDDLPVILLVGEGGVQKEAEFQVIDGASFHRL